MLPTALSLRREVERLPETLADVPTEEAVRAIVDDLNQRIRDSLMRPERGPRLIVHTVDPDAAVATWRTGPRG